MILEDVVGTRRSSVESALAADWFELMVRSLLPKKVRVASFFGNPLGMARQFDSTITRGASTIRSLERHHRA